MKKSLSSLLVLLVAVLAIAPSAAEYVADRRMTPMDVFELEYAADPQIAPDGGYVAYVRNYMDVMTDRRRTDVWLVHTDGGKHWPVTDSGDAGSPRWSPDGKRLLYVSSDDGSSQLYSRDMETGRSTRLTRLTEGPGGIRWSPDGRSIAFTMRVPARAEPFVTLPSAPEGAEWAEAARVIRSMTYRRDGSGYVEPGHRHLFVMPADGGTPRQLTSGEFNHDGTPSWTPDAEHLVFSANRHENFEHEPSNSEIYEVALADGKIRALTERFGPDRDPVVSPDGKRIAYLGYDDRYQGYQVMRLYVMNRDGSGARAVTEALDRSVRSPVWSRDGKGLYFRYDDRGTSHVGYVEPGGKAKPLVAGMGGTSIGRPYAGGSFSVSDDGSIAFNTVSGTRPGDVAVLLKGKDEPKTLTRLNEDLFGHKELATVEEIVFDSSHDGRSIQGWIAKPPGFDPQRKYPLILEIHGGPFANYGPRFAAEVQLFAAAGYVVVYINPRGSTSYGQEFGNLIHHNYPGEDYDDLMSGIDAVLAQGYVDPERMFVTGGSGGGVLTAWIVGKTDRFRAAVVAKPVINWYSFVLTADLPGFFYKYWFPGLPWDHTEHYMKRSPLSLAGNVETPTMLLTGEADYRTPMSESEQYYQALKLMRVDTALVRIPDASHGITARPSNLISKVAHILKWFEMYDRE
ncbi:MAG: S9 family peptidase [bacterium]|nr:S9 family peptidase [bacterium]